MFDTILISLILILAGLLIAFLIFTAFIAHGAARRGYVVDEHGRFYRWDFTRGPMPPRGAVDAREAATLGLVDY